MEDMRQTAGGGGALSTNSAFALFYGMTGDCVGEECCFHFFHPFFMID